MEIPSGSSSNPRDQPCRRCVCLGIPRPNHLTLFRAVGFSLRQDHEIGFPAEVIRGAGNSSLALAAPSAGLFQLLRPSPARREEYLSPRLSSFSRVFPHAEGACSWT